MLFDQEECELLLINNEAIGVTASADRSHNMIVWISLEVVRLAVTNTNYFLSPHNYVFHRPSQLNMKRRCILSLYHKIYNIIWAS